MSEFLFSSQNIPFTVALALMFGIAILEGILTVVGAGFSNLIEAFLPDVDLDANINGPEFQSSLSRLLSWLRIGKVPILMLLVVFLTAFGLIGLTIQSFVLGTAGYLLPPYIAALPTFILALPIMRILGGVLEKLIPKDETDAIEIASLVGRVAIITLGKSQVNSPAEAKVTDLHGTTHYVRVEPDTPGDVYFQGEAVLLLKYSGTVFKVTKNTNPSLVDI